MDSSALGFQIFGHSYIPHSSLVPPTAHPQHGGFSSYSQAPAPLDGPAEMNSFGDGNNKKRPKCPKAKKPRKTVEVVINGLRLDISGIPVPVCTCTGAAQKCYRWGAGGWQSACCTTAMSVYPLPVNPRARRPGTRIPGRKIRRGAFTKVLEKLVSEGFDLGNPIDLNNHWAKLGTNKFVRMFR